MHTLNAALAILLYNTLAGLSNFFRDLADQVFDPEWID